MEETTLKRVMPHNLEAEQAVIGSMLMDADAISDAAEILTEDDFYGKAYGILFSTMQELYNNSKSVDLVTLKDALDKKNVPAETINIDFIKNILSLVSTAANVRQYARIVKEKATLRRIIKVNESITNDCYAGKENVDDILENTEKKMFDLLQDKDVADYVPIKKVVMNSLEKMNLASKTKGAVTGIPSGFVDLDYKTTGFQNSDLILIAARPSMGKTAFVLNVAHYIAVKKNISAVVFSLEMSSEQLVNRLLAQDSMVNSQKIRTGELDDGEWAKLIESADAVGNSGLIIDDTPGISIGELRSKCRKYKLEKNIGIIIIDYLQLMKGNGKIESRQQEVSEISRSLKSLARELQVPVIALSQLSRAVESREGCKPMLSDLRESGAIEQDADVVMFLYREDYYKKDTERKNIAEVIIAKQRNGPIGTVELSWLPDYTKFANLEK